MVSRTDDVLDDFADYDFDSGCQFPEISESPADATKSAATTPQNAVVTCQPTRDASQPDWTNDLGFMQSLMDRPASTSQTNSTTVGIATQDASPQLSQADNRNAAPQSSSSTDVANSTAATPQAAVIACQQTFQDFVVNGSTPTLPTGGTVVATQQHSVSTSQPLSVDVTAPPLKATRSDSRDSGFSSSASSSSSTPVSMSADRTFYIKLIGEAIRQEPTHKLGVKDIYNYIFSQYPETKACERQVQQKVRYHLCRCNLFVTAGKANSKCKGAFHTFDPRIKERALRGENLMDLRAFLKAEDDDDDAKNSDSTASSKKKSKQHASGAGRKKSSAKSQVPPHQVVSQVYQQPATAFHTAQVAPQTQPNTSWASPTQAAVMQAAQNLQTWSAHTQDPSSMAQQQPYVAASGSHSFYGQQTPASYYFQDQHAATSHPFHGQQAPASHYFQDQQAAASHPFHGQQAPASHYFQNQQPSYHGAPSHPGYPAQSAAWDSYMHFNRPSDMHYTPQ